MRLMLAGLVVIIAGAISTAPHSGVVIAVGVAMILTAVYRDAVIIAAEALRQRSRVDRGAVGPFAGVDQIVRERWRETRTWRR